MDGLKQLVRSQRELPGRKAMVFFAEELQLPLGVVERFRDLISAANRANVAIYAIDSAGLRIESGATEARGLLGVAPRAGAEPDVRAREAELREEDPAHALVEVLPRVGEPLRNAAAGERGDQGGDLREVRARADDVEHDRHRRKLGGAGSACVRPRVEWRCIVYPHRLQEDLVRAMAEAGCVEVSLGFESGSPVVLREMNKRFTPDDVRATSE